MKRNENMKVNGGLEYINDTLGIIDKIEKIIDARQVISTDMKKTLETQCFRKYKNYRKTYKRSNRIWSIRIYKKQNFN